MKIVAGSYGDGRAHLVLHRVGMQSEAKIKDAIYNDKSVFLVTEDDVLRMSRKKIDPNKLEVYRYDNATVVLYNGEKFVSRPEKGEKFDPEKGLLVCLMKIAGLNTTNFLEVLENVKDCRNTVKCNKVKRNANKK